MVIKDIRIKDKRGWIRLIEVFIAILLITGALLIVARRNNTMGDSATYMEISREEIAVLRDIELNNSLRNEILSVNSLPVEWENFSTLLPNVKSRIEYLTPPNLKCQAKICWINRLCTVDELSGENIYAETVVISANLNKYSPRQLKLFCVEEEV